MGKYGEDVLQVAFMLCAISTLPMASLVCRVCCVCICDLARNHSAITGKNMSSFLIHPADTNGVSE